MITIIRTPGVYGLQLRAQDVLFSFVVMLLFVKIEQI